jgi:hypothetical protein
MNEADLAILKAERLRRQINAEARRFVVQIMFALGLAFALGVALGRFWR